jgi:tetratricopeptide (TPR) repeat protein
MYVWPLCYLVYDWDWSAAEHDAQKAVQLKPRNPRAIESIGWVNEALGRFDEAARLYKSALTLDPLNPGSYVRLSNVQIATGRLADGEASVRKMLQISRTYGEAHYDLGQILLLQGNFQSALTELQQEPSESARSAGLAEVYHVLKRRAESDAALTQLVREHAKDDAFDIAEVYAYRGEVDQAFTWLERAYRQRDASMVYIKSDTFLKNLHRDPRYVMFLRKMNLPE